MTAPGHYCRATTAETNRHRGCTGTWSDVGDSLRDCQCPCHKPKPEPEKDWLESSEFVRALVEGTKIGAFQAAIRANYISARERRFREALEKIAKRCGDPPPRAESCEITQLIAREALREPR